MPDTKYSRDTQIMDCYGLDLNRPVDSVKPSRFPFLQNCRSYQAGRIEPREGLTVIGNNPVLPGVFPVHSCRRLNDPLRSSFTRIVGIGTQVAFGTTSFTSLDTGYSGDPLALLPWKPQNAPYTFMYIGDRSRMRKTDSLGNLHQIGWPAPAISPVVNLSNLPKYKIVDEAQTSGAEWVAHGTAGGPSSVTRITGITIGEILYDNAPTNTGWASIAPSLMTGIGRGGRVEVDHGGGNDEIATIQATFPNSITTTIAAIIYDSGTTGQASIALTTPLSQVFCDALLRDTTVGAGDGQYARITAVSKGPDGTLSVRVSTSVSWSAGDTVQIQASFRVYLTQTHVNGEGLQINALNTAVSSGIGTITKTSALDLSTIGQPPSFNTAVVMAQPSDYMHISFKVDNPTVINELKVQLAVDGTPPVDGGNGGFQGNYYFKSFRAADITPAAANQTTLQANRQTVIQRGIVNQPNASPAEIAAAAPPPVIDPSTGEDVYQFANYTYTNPATGVTFYQQVTYTDYVDTTTGLPVDLTSLPMGSGYSQWAELIFPLSELIRVGTDASLSLANVSTIQLVINCSGSVNVAFDAWWIGGGYGPDTGDPTASPTPYKYRYRAREIATNVPSNWSPASRYDIQPFRQSVDVLPLQYVPPAGVTLTSANFVLDIERFGGLITDWHYAGTIQNTGSPVFTDVLLDDLIGGQPIIGQDNYQPWPILGTPVNGTTANVAGTTIQDSGTNFNLSWAPGTRIIVNQVPFTIYRVISTSLLETIENGTARGAVAWRIDEPTILAQPLPVLWEWDGALFACGDPVNPGRLYRSNPDSETTQPTNYLDITAPSEPLMNGVEYNARGFIWSSESFIQLLKTGNPDDPYRYERIPNGKGLFSRWAYTRDPAPILCFLAKDGINMTTGGPPTPLTDADLYELFPNEGNPGSVINGIFPPVVTAVNATSMRLEYYDDYLYFDFLDSNANPRTLVLAFDLGATVRGQAPGGWFYDIYTPPVVMHYGEEGQGVHSLLVGTTGSNLYQYTGVTDNGVPVVMQMSTPSRNQGDYRAFKLYGDIMVDCDLANLTASFTPFFNRNSLTGPVTTTFAVGRQQLLLPVAPLAAGTSWQTAQDISLFINVSVSGTAHPLFYLWESRWTFESAPLAAVSWEISPTTFGMVGFKHFGLCKITHVSSVNLLLIFIVDGVAQPAITIPNSGGIYAETIFRVPVMKGKLFKVRVASSDNISAFRLDTRDSYFEVKDWASDDMYAKLRIFGDFSLVEG